MKADAQAGRAAIEVAGLERVFRECFFAKYRTVLVGGGEEPLYLPSPDPGRLPHRIVYREDYLASALHEVAHWCLAGRRRRRLEDYGYWYIPDGRNADEQRAFEEVEAAPQALEWIFSDACGMPFHLSIDNLDGEVEPGPAFERAVESARRRFLGYGLPPRADVYRRALQTSLAKAAGRKQEPIRTPRLLRAEENLPGLGNPDSPCS